MIDEDTPSACEQPGKDKTLHLVTSLLETMAAPATGFLRLVIFRNGSKQASQQ